VTARRCRHYFGGNFVEWLLGKGSEVILTNKVYRALRLTGREYGGAVWSTWRFASRWNMDISTCKCKVWVVGSLNWYKNMLSLKIKLVYS
jgi:hypothetical protein